MEQKKETIEEIADDIFRLTSVIQRELDIVKTTQGQIENNILGQVELARKLKALVD